MSFYNNHILLPTSDTVLDMTKIYHIVFFNGDRLDTRPIKLRRLFKKQESEEVVAYWTYFFESKKTFVGKLTDKRLWNKVFSQKAPMVNQKITELDYFREEEPALLLKAMDWSFPSFNDVIIDYSNKFINIKNDIRNT